MVESASRIILYIELLTPMMAANPASERTIGKATVIPLLTECAEDS
jgi:hypothetical protein